MGKTRMFFNLKVKELSLTLSDIISTEKIDIVFLIEETRSFVDPNGCGFGCGFQDFFLATINFC